MQVFAPAAALACSVFAGHSLAQIALQAVPNLPNGERVTSGALSADGSTFVTAAGEGWRLRNGVWTANVNNTGRTITPIVHERGAFSNDGGVMIGTAMYPNSDGVMIQVAMTTRNGEWSPFGSTDPGSVHLSSRIPEFVRADGEWLATSTPSMFGFFRSAYRWDGSMWTTAPNPYTPVNATLGGFALGQDGSRWAAVSRDWSGAAFSESGGVGYGVRLHHLEAPSSFVRPAGSISGLDLADLSALSGDGRVAYGWYRQDSSTPPTSFRWSPQTGLALYSTNVLGSVISTSFDGVYAFQGNTIFSHTTQTSIPAVEFLTQLGIDTTGWSAVFVRGMTDDGTKLYGTGNIRLPSGQNVMQAWIVTIPTPGSLAIGTLAVFAASRRRR